ncbi:class IIb bacteriocin, lactobin A/cerein 7B family [Alkalimonas sp.]|nr:class IIb bacteriocin, lactobin A/cerein 7B family [Alkalimonas sp.]MCC5827194.1 class IIb bacteriocin, lactobin A/cerein 7B family [Alkalimonas sp.]
MQELTFDQVDEVSGGMAPLAFALGIVAIDLAIQGVHLAYIAIISD